MPRDAVHRAVFVLLVSAAVLGVVVCASGTEASANCTCWGGCNMPSTTPAGDCGCGMPQAGGCQCGGGNCPTATCSVAACGGSNYCSTIGCQAAGCSCPAMCPAAGRPCGSATYCMTGGCQGADCSCGVVCPSGPGPCGGRAQCGCGCSACQAYCNSSSKPCGGAGGDCVTQPPDCHAVNGIDCSGGMSWCGGGTHCCTCEQGDPCGCPIPGCGPFNRCSFGGLGTCSCL